MKKIIPILLIIGSSIVCAQTTAIHPLRVGDKLPNVTIANIVNYPANTAKIYDFKGKLLILDFWGVHCTSCIEEMPEMEKLQQEFGNQIQVLLVTADSKKQVQELFNKSTLVRNIHLPFVIADTMLSKLFPYTAFGLHVWIDANGVTVQKTSKASYSSKDIEQFLKGHSVDLAQRQDDRSFNSAVPLWIEGGGRQLKHIKYHSYIAENVPEYAGGSGRMIKDSLTKKAVGMVERNIFLSILYAHAFGEGGKHTWRKIIWEVNDSSQYFPPKDQGTKAFAEWKQKHTYYYELQVPVEKSEQLYSFMQQDLERYFDLHGKIEKRRLKCWVLVRGAQFEVLLHKSEGKRIPLSDDEEQALKKDSIIMHNHNMNTLLYGLYKFLPADVDIIDDATDYKQLIDINMHASNNYEVLKRELQKNGLDLKEEYRDLDCLVLREKAYIEKPKKTID